MDPTPHTTAPLTEGLDFPAPKPRGTGVPPVGRTTMLRLSAALLLLTIAALVAIKQLSVPGATTAADTRRRVAICAVSGELFRDLRIVDGDAPPWRNPRTGNRTLYEAEACFWTPGGGAKSRPAYVLLNEFRGLPGPTTCPDCGRTVVPHNPTPDVRLMAEALRAGR